MSGFEDVKTGDKVRFEGQEGRGWWTVRDRDDRYIVATRQAEFEPEGVLIYTVVDLTGWQHQKYNGAGNGVVRSSLNTMGGGWDLDADGKGTKGIIPALRSGKWEISHRRVTDARSVEIEGR